MKYKRIIYHTLFWIGFCFIYPIWIDRGNLYSAKYLNNFLSTTIGLPGFLIGLYYITYQLIPNLLLKRKNYLLFVLTYIGCMIIIILHEILTNRYVFLPLIEPGFIDMYHMYIFEYRHILLVFIMMQSQIFFFLSIKYFKNYVENYIENEKLKSKIAETELNMLKSQIHPHFLFNTLNNIYTLSIEGRNKQVSESIVKLSKILRYTLYECKDKYISLENEIALIKDYINLEKLRYSSLKLDISFPENTKNIYVIPLLLFTFIENSFKHGTSKSIKNKWLKVDLKILNNELHFSIKNSKSNVAQKDFLNHSKGIGLKNAFKRLDYYLGKGNYILNIKNETDYFEVFLLYINKVK